jgi:hypothetical protein
VPSVAARRSRGNVLLLYRTGATGGPFDTGGGVIPDHAGVPPTHFAFPIEAADFEPWMAKLASEGVKAESVVNWPKGATSIYFRDSDGNLADPISRGFWAID